MKNLFMKNTFVLFIIFITSVANAQLTYIGLSHQKKNRQRPNIRLKSDTLFVPTNNGLFKKSIHSTDTNWIEAGFQGMDINDFVLIGDDTIICVVDSSGENSSIFISTDNGNSYYNSTNGAGKTDFNFFPMTRVNFNPKNHNDLLIQSGTCVARSLNFGKTWTKIYGEWDLIAYQTNGLSFHPLDTSSIYSCGEYSIFHSYVHYSNNGGIDWETSNYEQNQAVNQMVFHPTDDNIIIAGKEGHISRSTDKGKTWTNVYDSPNYEYIVTMEFDPNNPNTIYASGGAFDVKDSVRIFRSDDAGKTWGVWKTFLIPDKVNHPGVMVFKLLDNYLYLMFGNAAMYTLENEIGNIEPISKESQVNIYPNPVVDVLLFSQHFDKDIDCSIHSFNGKLVAEKSIKNSALNVKDLDSGHYLLNFMFENKFHTYKFVKK